MTDILIITGYDYANSGYRFYQSLKSVGVDVEMIKRKGHKFGYQEQAKIDQTLGRIKAISKSPNIIIAHHLKEQIKNAKVVWFLGTVCVKTGVDLRYKNLAIEHSGSIYRQNIEECNEFFNKIVNVTVFQDADWVGNGAINDEYVVSGIDTNSIQPVYKRHDEKLLVGHFPSSPIGKGTEDILKIIRNLKKDPVVKNRFKYIGIPNLSKEHNVSYSENLKRIKKCDIIIEKCKLKQKGKPTGSWGSTAMECAALGKIVVTQFVRRDVYEREYGELGLQIGNGPDGLQKKLKEVLMSSDKEIQLLKEKSRAWVVKNHSFRSTGNRLMEKVFNRFFEEK